MGRAAGSVVLGLGLRAAAEPRAVAAFVETALDEMRLTPGEVTVVATVAARVGHPAVLGLVRRWGWEPVGLAPEALAQVAVPTPSEAVRQRTGTPSVAEAAALLTAARGDHAANLLLGKRIGPGATLAMAHPLPHPPSKAAETAR